MTSQTFHNIGPSFIGFDRLISQFEKSTNYTHMHYPPFDIIQKSEDEFSIQLALAGFSLEDIDIELTNGVLAIASTNKINKESLKYIHKGISTKQFSRSFTLAEYIEVESAHYSNGILTVNLKRKIPDEKKPRKIAISGGVETQELLLES
jgi:molecular chaperone IbpA